MLSIKELINDIKLNKLSFKNYLKYYKIAIILKDKHLYEILSNVTPNDINRENEEVYYESISILTYKLKYA